MLIEIISFLESTFHLYRWEMEVDVATTVNLHYFFYCFIELEEENNTFLCPFRLQRFKAMLI